ncbi:Structural maintenance of chromosomes protein 5 [Coemansia sp. RSA 552]|nr:Structural maintenance of chromosomes protein 5 [Coemansia sp. RSA 552]
MRGRSNGHAKAEALAKGEPMAAVKRQRRRRRASTDSSASSEASDIPQDLATLRIGGSTNHSTAEYRPGAITKISLRHFVTYDRMEVVPGPHMNMILGANGSGKSSLVCAIALGLGERPAVLGRAKEVSEFVKHGHEQATIEITLATDSGELRVRRDIIREKNKTLWKLNGRSASQTEVLRTVRELNIQVGNLCQFLPQDRVVEFSKMTAQDLLRETQKAVGREDLLGLQTQLAEQRKAEKQAMGELNRLGQDTEQQKKRNEVLEADVRRWQEQQEAESQMRVLTALVPLVRYSEAKAEHDRTKEQRREAHKLYLEARDASGPAEEEMAELEQRIAQAEAERRQLQDSLTGTDRSTRQRLARLERFDSTQRDLTGELDDLKQRAERRRAGISQLRTEVAQLEESHPEEPPEGESRELMQLGSELSQEMLQMKNELIHLQDQQKGLERSGNQLSGDIASRSQQLRDLDDVDIRRREALKRFNEDTHRALLWLEANRERFTQHVFSPICLEAAVQDTRYAGLVETIVTASSLRTFVAQCEADYHLFTREVNDRLKLRVDVVYIRRTLDDFHPPQPRSVIQELGFTGYALDYVTAPAPVLAALCQRDGIHEVPLSLGSVDHERIERDVLFKEYIADGTRYLISRGRYGSRAATVSTQRVRQQARLLSSGETDEVREQRQRLRDEIEEIQVQLDANETKMRKLVKREQKVRDTHRSMERREEELRQQRVQMTKALSRWERQKVHIETKRAQLASMVAEDRRDGSGRVADERRAIEKRIRDNARARADALTEIANAVAEMTTTAEELAAASVAGHGDARRLGDLRAEAARVREAVTEAKLQFDRLSEAYTAAKQAAKECLAETRRITEEMTDEERQRVREAQDAHRDAGLDQLELELATCRQRLSLASNSGLSARVLEEFEQRKRQLDSMAAQMKQLEAELHRARKKKRRLRSQWEAPLDEIVRRIGTKFREMFDSIGCIGDIALLRAGDGVLPSSAQDSDQEAAAPRDDEDYGSWGIEIRVAFRQNEALQVLDNHRQSGGERAVSTILYLQAMQEMVAAPFRVVDEINQGMDQRNERMIHEIVVQTACQPGASQYFLITPKLLPDLSYHPMMKILCIFNGEWQPESLSFSKYISNARRRA